MLHPLVAAIMGLSVAVSVAAQVQPFPAGFVEQDVASNGTTIHVWIGGQGTGGRPAARLW